MTTTIVTHQLELVLSSPFVVDSEDTACPFRYDPNFESSNVPSFVQQQQELELEWYR
jgi:hypothetical protein